MSTRLKGHEVGAIVSAADLQGANISALVAAGHLRLKTIKKAGEARKEDKK
jgi:hypothetical protein